MEDEEFRKMMDDMDKEDRWITPTLLTLGIIVFIFFILAVTGNIHYLFELFGG